MDRHGVREMGLKSFFRFRTGVFWGRKVTSAYFQELGSRCSLKEAFRMVGFARSRPVAQISEKLDPRQYAREGHSHTRFTKQLIVEIVELECSLPITQRVST